MYFHYRMTFTEYIFVFLCYYTAWPCDLDLDLFTLTSTAITFHHFSLFHSIGQPGTELRHILAIYIIYIIHCALDLVSQKLGHKTQRSWWMYVHIWKFIDLIIFDYSIINCRIFGPVAKQPALPWQPFVSHSSGVRHHVSFQLWTWYDHLVLSYCNF